MIKTTGHPRASAVVDDPMAQAMVHFLTHHSEPTLVVLLADWLPRNGRHWHLLPDVDALALSMEAWECGAMDATFQGGRHPSPAAPPVRAATGPELVSALRRPTALARRATGRSSMSSREIVVLPGGLTIERVASGLFEVTFADPDGVSSDLMDMWDLQQLIDELAADLAS